MPTLAYCATLNNYTPDEVATLRNGHEKVSYMVVGHEVGDEGTPHLQIYFQLANQVKLTTIKRWGGPWAKMHMENSRGSDDDNYRYCTKEGSFWEIGERRSMPGTHPSSRYQDGASLIAEGLRRCCLEAMAAILARQAGAGAGRPEDHVGMGTDGEGGENIPEQLFDGLWEGVFAGNGQEVGSIIYPVQGPEGNRRYRSNEEDGGPYGWALQPSGGPEEPEDHIPEVRLHDDGLWEEACGVLRELQTQYDGLER